MRVRFRTNRLECAVIMAVAALVATGCRPQGTQAATAAPVELKGIVSVKELMENIVDPQADYIFDAVAVDVDTKGAVETKPTTDEDWLKVQRGAMILVEASNLLKLPRRIAPLGDKNNSGGASAPELSPEQIQAKVDQDRTLWNKYSDGLREAALNTVKVARARDAEALFNVGSEIDKACENCHLEYWYPGDRKAVLEDQKKHVTYDPPKSPAPAKK